MSVSQVRADVAVRRKHWHEAVFYEGPEGLLAEVLPFVREGVEQGEPVLVAMVPDHLVALESALGEDATRVDFVDMSELGANPACIIPEWRRFVADIGDAGPVRGVGEPVWPGRRDVELEEALLHEALLNLAFDGDSGLSLLCPYDVEHLPAPVIEEAARVHSSAQPTARWAGSAPGGRAEPSRGFHTPHAPAAGPTDLWEFDADELDGLRRVVARLASIAGLGRAAVDDVVLAAHELATNSVVHAGGKGVLRSWVEPGAFVVEVSDAGVIDDPLVGRNLPEDVAEHGRGLWLANQLCDLVQLRSGEAGTVVRLFSWL
jgi:anti-sigma regulatory factor (Ser/Thr protein kinase)